jgi:hypothetical protein
MNACALLIAALAFSEPAVPYCPSGTPGETRILPCGMTRYSTPLKLSGALGLSFNRVTGYDTYRGFFFLLEPGVGGGKINAGYRFGAAHIVPIWNAGLSASVMRTWGNPLGDVEPGQTYLGAELTCALFMLGLNGGIYGHVAGDDEEHDWIYTLGVGGGF